MFLVFTHHWLASGSKLVLEEKTKPRCGCLPRWNRSDQLVWCCQKTQKFFRHRRGREQKSWAHYLKKNSNVKYFETHFFQLTSAWRTPAVGKRPDFRKLIGDVKIFIHAQKTNVCVA
jgi:hypothetical protein